MKRRIINELPTTYLPSVLILAIVYATNFVKPFFFEAVVTVNLTALLVLTTLFISLSGKLPPIDIWLTQPPRGVWWGGGGSVDKCRFYTFICLNLHPKPSIFQQSTPKMANT